MSSKIQEIKDKKSPTGIPCKMLTDSSLRLNEPLTYLLITTPVFGQLSSDLLISHKL